MFFKKRVNVRDYCTAKLQALTSYDNLQVWAAVQDDSDDKALRIIPAQRLIDELLAAHAELLSLALTKRYHNAESYLGVGTMAVEMSLKSFFASRGNPGLYAVKDEYNRAFGSSPVDGVREMVALFNHRIAGGALTERSTKSIYDLLYRSLASYFADFKRINLIFGMGS